MVKTKYKVWYVIWGLILAASIAGEFGASGWIEHIALAILITVALNAFLVLNLIVSDKE